MKNWFKYWDILKCIANDGFALKAQGFFKVFFYKYCDENCWPAVV